jgi:hypothetical protein
MVRRATGIGGRKPTSRSVSGLQFQFDAVGIGMTCGDL